MTAYYNEFDPKAAAWLRELIKQGHIAKGDVDERSIEDVRPNDLKGYTQCHFFAGIGVWSYALRSAGWSDDYPVWTGSCPCQPFSAAGKGAGFADERHLWPAFHHLIKECIPDVVFGEQVASKDGLAWLDLVQTDLEGEGYAIGAVDTCAAGFGAPHIRQRLYWVADAGCKRYDRKQICLQPGKSREDCVETSRGSRIVKLADPECEQREGSLQRHREEPSQNSERQTSQFTGRCSINGMADASGAGREGNERNGSAGKEGKPSGYLGDLRPSPANGLWRDADWLFCRDGKWRPVESIDVEMADGVADRLGYVRIGDRHSLNPLIQKGENRIMRLRGYGNAVTVGQAVNFIEAFLDVQNQDL